MRTSISPDEGCSPQALDPPRLLGTHPPRNHHERRGKADKKKAEWCRAPQDLALARERKAKKGGLSSTCRPVSCSAISQSAIFLLRLPFARGPIIARLVLGAHRKESGVRAMHVAKEKEMGGGSSVHDKAGSSEAEMEVEDDGLSLSSASTDSLSSTEEEIQSIQQTLSRNAGLEEHDKGLAHITTVTTNMTTDPRFEVDLDETDNPQDWSMLRKSIVIFFMSFSTLVVVMYSTSYTSGIPGMMGTFHVASKTVLVLGVTTYLAGLALGSIILAPLSEMYGRRPVYLIAVLMFCVLIVPCALAQNLATILAVRFFGAIAGSAMISNAPGTVADIVSDDYRALAFSIWSIGPMNGPVIGPLIGGFVFQFMGWRWTNWVVMIGSGVSWVMVLLIGETYAPAILRAKSAKKRRETGDERWYSRYDDKKKFWAMLKENLIRPLEMSVKEPIW